MAIFEPVLLKILKTNNVSKNFYGMCNNTLRNFLPRIPNIPLFGFSRSRFTTSVLYRDHHNYLQNLQPIVSKNYCGNSQRYLQTKCLSSISTVFKQHQVVYPLLKSHNHLVMFQICSRNYSNKKDNIQSNIISLKTKKREKRKKTIVDELSDRNAEGFNLFGHHKFLTFDPDFAIPDSSERRSKPREFEIVAYATADEFNLQNLSTAFHKQGLYIETLIASSPQKEESESPMAFSSTSKLEDVLFLNAVYQVTREARSIHIFRNGAVVFWNMPSLERQNVLKFIKNYEIEKYEEEMVQEESESLVYTYTNTPTRLKSNQNLILLNEEGDKDLEKFAFSNALAMSVKLGIWEASLESYIESIEHVTEEMQKSGVVVLNQNEVLQRLGQLFALRHVINLSSDLLDTPDFYWDHERLEPLYNQLARHLSIQKRTAVMNTKLSHCSELMELLKSYLHDRHSSKLELIIIILIAIEVFFEIIHFL